MKEFRKLFDKLRRTPPSAEDIEAKAEAMRIRDELETARLSQRSTSGQNYQSGGGTGL